MAKAESAQAAPRMKAQGQLAQHMRMAHGTVASAHTESEHLLSHLAGNAGHTHPHLAKLMKTLRAVQSGPPPGPPVYSGTEVPGSGNWAFQRNG
jgi:hypothetical protein